MTIIQHTKITHSWKPNRRLIDDFMEEVRQFHANGIEEVEVSTSVYAEMERELNEKFLGTMTYRSDEWMPPNCFKLMGILVRRGPL